MNLNNLICIYISDEPLLLMHSLVFSVSEDCISRNENYPRGSDICFVGWSREIPENDITFSCTSQVDMSLLNPVCPRPATANCCDLGGSLSGVLTNIPQSRWRPPAGNMARLPALMLLIGQSC